MEVQDVGLKGLGFRVEGSGFRVKGLGFRMGISVGVPMIRSSCLGHIVRAPTCQTFHGYQLQGIQVWGIGFMLYATAYGPYVQNQNEGGFHRS